MHSGFLGLRAVKHDKVLQGDARNARA